MKHRLGRVSVLMVALVLVVGVMGAGFASWTDQLVVNGVVTTADFQVGICDVTATGLQDLNYMVDLDWGPNYLPEEGGMLYPGNPPTDPWTNGSPDPQFGSATNEEFKNVASTNSYNVTDSLRFNKDVHLLGDAAPFYGAIREEIHNAYPWYASGVVICIANNGSIPLHIVDVDFEPVGATDCSVLQWLELHDWWWCVHDATTCSGVTNGPTYTGMQGAAGLEYFLSGWEGGKPFQLEPCHTLWLQLNWHFEQDIEGPNGLMVMPQNADCEFLITIDAEQWAE
ncbi:MAG: hypothetical protein JW846_03275 [Dehalococcoidia bacterium]|nr:hypothetical protein [Dehalococcoidia bacterium]